MGARTFAFFFLFVFSASAAVTVRYEPASPDVGPFPSDVLTVPDPAQHTGLRINLPLPDCAGNVSLCDQLKELNRYDGFALEPRIRIRFTGAINPDTIRYGVYLIALDFVTAEEYGLHRKGDIVWMNNLTYDPATFTAYARADEVLDQHRRYALIVTDGVKDATGAPVVADPRFSACVRSSDGYCNAVNQSLALQNTQWFNFTPVAATVFTTMSATIWTERAAAAVRSLGPTRSPSGTLVRISDIGTASVQFQTAVNPVKYDEILVPDNFLGTLSSIYFGSFTSPYWAPVPSISDGRFGPTLPILTVPTNSNVPLPVTTPTIQYHVYYPSTPKPPSGYPVVIYGHGYGDSSFGGPTVGAVGFATTGYATISINAVGHGGGPQSRLVYTDKAGAQHEILIGGRSLDDNNDGIIEPTEGCVLQLAGTGARDCLRQTALDLVALVREIKAGIPDLDPNRIYYVGQSLGSIYGSILNAIEPGINAAALNSGGGSFIDIATLSPAYEGIAANFLARQSPSIKVARPSQTVALRYQRALVLSDPAFVDAQNALDLYNWIGTPGDPIAYAPHFRASTLPGMWIKPVMFQFPLGDRSVPNPAESNLVRSARMQDMVQLFRNDIARSIDKTLPENPHAFITNFATTNQLAIAYAAQTQIAGFFETDGAVIPDANTIVRLLFGRNLFENPAVLPDNLNY